jgi:small subunit ribosomal protein S27e
MAKERFPGTVSKFLKVKCPDCGNDQVLFNKASTVVNCLVCGSNLAQPAGGLAGLKGEVVGEVE